MIPRSLLSQTYPFPWPSPSGEVWGQVGNRPNRHLPPIMCSGNLTRTPWSHAQPGSVATFSATYNRTPHYPRGMKSPASELPGYEASPWGITSLISPPIKIIISSLFPQVPHFAKISTLPWASFPRTLFREQWVPIPLSRLGSAFIGKCQGPSLLCKMLTFYWVLSTSCNGVSLGTILSSPGSNSEIKTWAQQCQWALGILQTLLPPANPQQCVHPCFLQILKARVLVHVQRGATIPKASFWISL